MEGKSCHNLMMVIEQLLLRLRRFRSVPPSVLNLSKLLEAATPTRLSGRHAQLSLLCPESE